MTSHEHHEHRGGLKDWLLSRTGIAILLVVAVLAFLIYTEHTAHLLGAIPYLLLLACPLMHIFMHRGHQHHGGDHANRSR
jgi:hypothetical protein